MGIDFYPYWENGGYAAMRVLVPVKRVIDYNVKVRVKPDGSGPDLANVKMSMNPFDEIAMEEAIRLKEKGMAQEVIAVSIGVRQAQETLRTALAMGADRAILIIAAESAATDIEPLAVAKLLKGVIEAEKIDLVIAGMLVSMGMLMLPPVLISLPFKLLLFVLVDGWQLVSGSLLTSVTQPETLTAVAGIAAGGGP